MRGSAASGPLAYSLSYLPCQARRRRAVRNASCRASVESTMAPWAWHGDTIRSSIPEQYGHSCVTCRGRTASRYSRMDTPRLGGRWFSQQNQAPPLPMNGSGGDTANSAATPHATHLGLPSSSYLLNIGYQSTSVESIAQVVQEVFRSERGCGDRSTVPAPAVLDPVPLANATGVGQ